MDSLCSSIRTVLEYLTKSSNSLKAINAIRSYVSQRLKEVEFFGSGKYTANEYEPIDGILDNYLQNKNQATLPDKEFEVTPGNR